MNAAQRQFAAHLLTRHANFSLRAAMPFMLGVLLLLGGLFAVRRIALNPITPLPIGTTLATAVALLLLAYAIRRAAAGQFFSWLPTIMLACWAVACSFPGSQPLAWILWASVIAADRLLATRNGELTSGTLEHTAASLGQVSDVAEPTENAPHDESAGENDPTEQDSSQQCLAEQESIEPPIDSGEVVLQHVVRIRDAEGREYVHATLRGELKPGERATTLYVGFCPPFPTVPQVEAEVIEGPPAIAKVVQSLHNGVQIEVQLDSASLESVALTVEAAAYEMEDSGVGSQGSGSR